MPLTDEQKNYLRSLQHSLYWMNHDNDPESSGPSASAVAEKMEELVNILLDEKYDPFKPIEVLHVTIVGPDDHEE